jgi:excisionase family DNA binding protein
MKNLTKGLEASISLMAEGLERVGPAAKFLGISRSQLYLMMESGELPFVKLGKCRCVPRLALKELAARHLAGGGR